MIYKKESEWIMRRFFEKESHKIKIKALNKVKKSQRILTLKRL